MIPERLRKIIGKRELTAPLGGDRCVALRQLPASVANFQDQIQRRKRSSDALRNRQLERGTFDR